MEPGAEAVPLHLSPSLRLRTVENPSPAAHSPTWVRFWRVWVPWKGPRKVEGGVFRATYRVRRPTPFSVRPGASLIFGLFVVSDKECSEGKRLLSPAAPPSASPSNPWRSKAQFPHAGHSRGQLGGCLPNSAPAPTNTLCCRARARTHTNHAQTPRHKTALQRGKPTKISR